MNKYILIGGYYGAGNLGDEAILQCILKDIRAQNNSTSFIVTSWNPEQTATQFNVEAIHWKDIAALLEASKRADMIILGGGGLLQDYWGIKPDTYLRRASMDITTYASLPLLAKIMNIPCMIYAMGLGPLQSDLALEHTRLAFDRSLVATLRDQASLELLEKTGFIKNAQQTIQVTADPVFTLTTSQEDEKNVARFLYKRDIDDHTDLIALSLRFWDQTSSLDNWLPRIAEELNRYLAEHENSQLILLPFQSDPNNPYTDDLAILKHLYQFLSNTWRVHLIEQSISPQFAQTLLQKCDVVVGMRLHSLILAINTGTPVIALPYDPKVASLMKEAGVEEYSCQSISPQPEELTKLIDRAIKNRADLKKKLQTFASQKKALALENVNLAINTLNQSQRTPITFAQDFAFQTLLQLEKVDEEQEQAQVKNEATLQRIHQLEAQSAQLAEIQSSKFWKLAKLYYRIAQDSPLKFLYQFLTVVRYEGFTPALKKSYQGVVKRLQLKQKTTFKVSYVDESSIDATQVLQQVIRNLNDRKLKGIFVVTSAFPFDEFYNQRVINLAKFLSAENWGVIFVAWRWSKDEKMLGIGQEVYKNIFQIPVDMFLENQIEMSGVVAEKKYFVVQFPHPEFFTSALSLAKYNFKIVYEIIDEWEEFHKVGQAIWFNKNIEQAVVLNANVLTAVSKPLIEKFSSIRKDIHLLPNGYDPALLGKQNRAIAKRNSKNTQLQIGYFGHLTESWFDWDFLFSVLEQIKTENLDLHFHLIGYGEPNLADKFKQYQNHLTFHGRVQPADLWKYAQNWDAALICFKSNVLSEAVDPLKIYEYGFFGLPVIVKGISHLNSFSYVNVIQTEAQFIDAARQIQNQPNSALGSKKELDLILESSTWKQRFSELLRLLEKEQWISF